ncbi:MAG: hypothetical protein R3332_03780 [Pseudohongiellaceae bacterium]|nr:hypothetical protein [Pseudohongiellaceae bacterium]
MTVKNLRFLLKEIELYYDGDEFVPKGKKGRAPYAKDRIEQLDNLIEASLIYPRSGTPEVSTLKKADLPSRTVVAFDTNNFWESGLFKEDIDTETKFLLTIADKDSVSKSGKWLRKILSAVIDTALGAKVKAISNLFQGAVASDLKSKIVSNVKGQQADPSIKSLCCSKEVYIDLLPSGLEAYTLAGKKRKSVLRDGEMVLPLYATANIDRNTAKSKATGKGKPRQALSQRIFKKGEQLGTAKLVLVWA